MDDQQFDIAEAKTHLSRLIERLKGGETITIARNNRPVAIVTPVERTAGDILAAIDAVRERVRREREGNVLGPGENWRASIGEGRSH